MSKYRKMLQLETRSLDKIMELLATQSKTTICNWSLNYAEKVILPIWIKNAPTDKRPQAAITAAREWLAGKIKLPQAKAVILDCHTAARGMESNPAALGAARTIGQAAATIHAPTHSIGIALYGALAVAYDELGIDTPWAELENRAAEECDKILADLKAVSVMDEPHPAKINWRC